MVFWIYRKNQVLGVKVLGKRILNFQISWTRVTYGLAYLSLLIAIQINPFTVLLITFALFAGNTIFIIFTNGKIIRGDKEVYPYSLKLIS